MDMVWCLHMHAVCWRRCRCAIAREGKRHESESECELEHRRDCPHRHRLPDTYRRALYRAGEPQANGGDGLAAGDVHPAVCGRAHLLANRQSEAATLAARPAAYDE